ncbi:MAG: alpha-amylase family glycosyl hydrolase [Anaerolineae bacterium]
MRILRIGLWLLSFLFLTLLTACAPVSTPAPPVLTVAPPLPAGTVAAQTATIVPPTVALAGPTARATVTPLRASRHPAIQTPAWFGDVVLYEIFVRSFNDSNGDGIGDLKGITLKLDYLKELGVGAIWLTPIFASPSYHGYDISDYYQINPDFGTRQDLIDLVQEAHKRNIKVLLDYVVGHTSDQHPFFKDAFGNPTSKYSDYYVWTNAAHTQYDSFAGVKEMPHLNQTNPETAQYLIDMARYWMTVTGNGDPRQGIDGYRSDYALGVPHEFWKQLRPALKALNPNFVLLAEAWTTGALQIDPYYADEFDATFDFPVYGDIEGNQDQVNDSTLLGVRNPALVDGDLISESVLYPPGAERVVFINNHDTNRVMSEVKGDLARAKLGALFLLTQSGTPMIYYGEEIGMSGVKAPAPDYDKTRREPMDWYAAETGPGMTTWYKPADRNNKPNDGISVQEEQGKPDSLLAFYRQLAVLRNANPALRTGSREAIQQGSSKVYAYLRRDDQTAFVVMLNFDSQPATVTLDLGPTSLPDGQYKAVDVLTQKEYAVDGLTLKVELGAAQGALLKLVSR